MKLPRANTQRFQTWQCSRPSPKNPTKPSLMTILTPWRMILTTRATLKDPPSTFAPTSKDRRLLSAALEARLSNRTPTGPRNQHTKQTTNSSRMTSSLSTSTNTPISRFKLRGNSCLTSNFNLCASISRSSSLLRGDRATSVLTTLHQMFLIHHLFLA